MNIRKNIDYTELYEALDELIARQLPQMELYCEIGKAVSRRTEKGAAVMASEYLNKNYPDVKGFSPRSLRRIRDFYRTYEGHPSLLSRAMNLGWTHNVVIMEADLTMDLREWYMRATEQFGWSKIELMSNIASNVHDIMILNEEIGVSSTSERVSDDDINKMTNNIFNTTGIRLYRLIRNINTFHTNCKSVWYWGFAARQYVSMRC